MKKKKASGTPKSKYEKLDTKVYKMLSKCGSISKAMKMMNVQKLRDFQLYVHADSGYGWTDLQTTLAPETFPWANFEKAPSWRLVQLPDSKLSEYYVMGSYRHEGVTYNVRIPNESLPLIGRFLRKYGFKQSERLLKTRLTQFIENETRFNDNLEKNLKTSQAKVKQVQKMYKQLLFQKGSVTCQLLQNEPS